MDQIVVESGKPAFIEEIISDVDCWRDKSVGVIGKLSEHMVDMCAAKIMDPQSKHVLLVDTSLIEPFPAKFGSLFHMIGELGPTQYQTSDLCLKARVVRCVDGMDLKLYRQAVDCQRNYLALRETK